MGSSSWYTQKVGCHNINTYNPRARVGVKWKEDYQGGLLAAKVAPGSVKHQSQKREENDGAGKPISSSDVALTHASHSNNLLQNVPFT